MEKENIESLLEKFWMGETSETEEKALKAFFNSGKAPLHLEKEAELFRYYAISKNAKLDNETFDDKVIKQINASRFNFRWMKIAATLLILAISVYAVYELRTVVDTREVVADNVQTFEDPELAYEQTKKALLMISTKLNSPTEYTEELAKINDAASIFKK